MTADNKTALDNSPLTNINYFIDKIISTSPADKSDGTNYADHRIYAEHIRYWVEKALSRPADGVDGIELARLKLDTDRALYKTWCDDGENPNHHLAGLSTSKIGAVIDHLAENGYLQTPEKAIEGLEAALMNAVSPAYKFHAHCPDCQVEFETDNGEWLIWCGTEQHANAILEAAKRHLASTKKEG